MKGQRSGFTLIEMVTVLSVLGGMVVMSLGLLTKLNEQSVALDAHFQSRQDWLRLADVWRQTTQQYPPSAFALEGDQAVFSGEGIRHVFRLGMFQDAPNVRVLHHEMSRDGESKPLRIDRYVLGKIGEARFDKDADETGVGIVWSSRSSKPDEVAEVTIWGKFKRVRLVPDIDRSTESEEGQS